MVQQIADRVQGLHDEIRRLRVIIDMAACKPAPAGTVKVPMTIKVEPELREYLRLCENATEAIETALKRSKAFRDFKRER